MKSTGLNRKSSFNSKDIKRSGKGIPPAQPAQVVVPKYVAPARRGQIDKVVIPEHATPVRPGKKEKPETEPGQQEKP
jgi:hypothetical protein